MRKTNQHTACPCRVLALLLALIFAAGVLTGCSSSGSGESAGDGGAKKTFTLTVVHKDGSSKDFSIETTQETLGAALLDEGLIAGDDSEYGLFVTTVDGETADGGSQEWWCLTAGGGQVATGVDSTPIEDGGQYEFTLTIGY